MGRKSTTYQSIDLTLSLHWTSLFLAFNTQIELFGDTVFDNVDTAYAAMAESIASFEQTETFFAFDSKYDRSLRGEYVYDPLSKVPTLRNVAVTGPYMHNGVFRELKTVIEFYDHFLEGSTHALNPETGLPWSEPEVLETVSEIELKEGRKLSDAEVEAMVCFLRTLTDARYEHLIADEGIDCGG